jgi:hypothetical protein
MTVTPAVLYALSVFALVGGRVFGGVQWHHWHRLHRGRRTPGSVRAIEDAKS